MNQRITFTTLIAVAENGQRVPLDLNKVSVVDKQTGKPIFDDALDATPTAIKAGEVPTDTQEYTVQFDTPEGRMEYVKNGNWSGVRKA